MHAEDGQAMPGFTLADLARILHAELTGDGQCVVTGMGMIGSAVVGQITFLGHLKYLKCLKKTQASAVILTAKHLADCPTNALVVNDPYLAYAQLSEHFAYRPVPVPAIHDTAVIGHGGTIDPSATIGPHVVIGDHVHIGPHVVLEAGVFLGDGVTMGAHAWISSGVHIHHHVQIGARVRIHSGAVLGADGFGFAKNPSGQWQKIHQLGRVLVADDVEIGANTTIDRGALGDTVIGQGVKLDNQIQIAHNVQIGARTVIAACSGVAGSTQIGSDCMIGGGVGIADHITIADQVHITGMTTVTKSILNPGVYSSAFPHQPIAIWRKNVAYFRQLGKWMNHTKTLENTKNE